MKSAALTVPLLLAASLALAEPEPALLSTDAAKFQEQVFYSTVRITVPDETGKSASIGTGFIVKVPMKDDPSGALTLLISGRHVYGDPERPIILNFHRLKDDASGPELGEAVPFAATDFSSVYFDHPDPSVDLACLIINAINRPDNHIFYKHLTEAMFYDFSEAQVLAGDEVWFVGYPENRFDSVHNLPLLRKGAIASIPQLDFNDGKQFVIDAQVYNGSSGSPVFARVDGHFKFMGVLAQALVQQGRLQPSPFLERAEPTELMGLGIVIKAERIRELINTVKEKRKLMMLQEAARDVL